MNTDICVCSATIRNAWGTKIENSVELCDFCSKLIPKILEDPPNVQSSNDGNAASISISHNSLPDLPASTALTGDIQLLIAAQDRTTHSVRAFVRFLFIQLSATSAAAVLWGLASAQVDPVACAQSGEHCSPVGALQAFAVIIWILGVIWSSIAGWEELKKSEIPK